MIVLVCGMARAKEFDEAEVLDRALELFRARGFKHTSFADLTSSLGVNRQSLYDTYGDKHTLYQSALKRYSARSLDMVRRKLDDPKPIREVLASLIDGMIASNCDGGSPGCLLVNSMVELVPHDADTRALVQAHADELDRLLAARLTLAQRKGEMSKSKDPSAIARFLRHTMLGMSVASRALGERAGLVESSRVALQVLD
jgi:TetR/AcrR family transcriptional repressor of nem operon